MKEVWLIAKKFIFEPPQSLPAAIWRGVALWLITSALAVGWIATQNPEVIEILSGQDRGDDLADLISEDDGSPVIKKLINDFVFRHQPSRLALVARVSNVGVKLIWSNQDAARWPTSVDGYMSPSMKPILGHLAFDGCWHGKIPNSDDKWVFCGISDSDTNHGYLVASWSPNSEMGGPQCVAELKALAQRISEVLF